MKRLAAISLLVLFGILFFLGRGEMTGWDPISQEFQEGESVNSQERALVQGGEAERLAVEGEADLVLPALNRSLLLDEAKREEEENSRFIFATSRDVQVAPHTHGEWKMEGSMATWSMQVESVGADTLNLGFKEFYLPSGAMFTFRSADGRGEDVNFFAKDNDAHGQLWTPILRTDRVELALSVPQALASEVRLALHKVNHGFRSPSRTKAKIGRSSSGSCNVDVVCSAADDRDFGPLVDQYRDQIRSVGAYTLGGIETCSGALINNTLHDGRPFFLTANHCGITPFNASSVVVYWNFENSTCRQPGSIASGLDGNGPITQFNSGAIFLASYEPSDMCLIELDDRVNSTFKPYFSGWNRTASAPPMVVGIHHPGVSEKRISFELDQTRTTFYGEVTLDIDGTHIRVDDWDFGTTEGGSSGSPLFNQSGQIVGQLHGGSAACGNNEADWYGRFFRSWTGGGGNNSRLSHWLDPARTDEAFINGANTDIFVDVIGSAVNEGDSGTRSAEVTLTLSEVSPGNLSVRLRSSHETTSADDFVAVDQVVTFPAGQAQQVVQVAIRGDLTPEEHETFTVFLSDANNVEPGQDRATVTILNDDFIDPVVTSSLSASLAEQESLSYQITAQNTPLSYQIENGPEGLTVNEMTGHLSWVPLAVGEYTVDVIAVNPAGEGRATLTISVTPNTLAEALDLSGELILENGIPGWHRQIVVTHDGVDAAQANDIGANSSAEFSTTIIGPDLVSFWWKVESEERYDYLSVRIDGEVAQAISGEQDWIQAEILLPEGEHVVSWVYEKDDSVDFGSDTAWVDQLVLGSSTGLPVIVSARQLVANIDEEVSYQILSLGEGATYQVSNLPGGLVFDGVDTITGSVNSMRFAVATLRATLPGGGVSTAELEITIVEDVGVGLDDSSLDWQHSGEAFWTVDRLIHHDGEDSARSGDAEDGESSILSAEITGPDAVSFFWKVDSEEFFDFLLFKLDGEVVELISGDQDWERVEMSIPSGRHVLTWEYFKDPSSSVGADAGWVDELRFLSDGKPFVRVESLEYPLVGEPLRVDLEIFNSPSLIEYPGMPAWLSVDPETGDLIGTPTELGPVDFIVRATNLLGVIETPVSLIVGGVNPNLDYDLDMPNIMVSTIPVSESWVSGFDFAFQRTTAAAALSQGDNGTSQMTLYLQGPGRVIFDWAVSSEEFYDFLVLELDGQVLDRISGNVSMTEKTVVLSEGVHEVSFFYRKDGSDPEDPPAGWRDSAWVDNVRLEGYAQYLTRQDVSHVGSRRDDDHDGDGFGAFEEYAFGGDLNDDESPGEVVFEAAPGGGMEMMFQGLQNAFDVDYTIQTSVNLKRGSWVDSELAPSFSNGRRGMQTYTFDLQTNKKQDFFRLNVTPKTPN